MIEMRPALLVSPRVHRMARFLGMDPAFRAWMFRKQPPPGTAILSIEIVIRAVVSTLMQVWATARPLTTNGFFPGADLALIDRIAGIPSFGAAMREVGWLEVKADGILLPEFTKYNSGHTNRVVVSPEGWDRFWAAYPRKVGKGAALKAWKKIRPNREMVERILTALEKQKVSRSWKESQGRYIPNPATWLNQSRWEDSPSDATESDVERINRIRQEQARRAELARKEREQNIRSGEPERVRKCLDELLRRVRDGYASGQGGADDATQGKAAEVQGDPNNREWDSLRIETRGG